MTLFHFRHISRPPVHRSLFYQGVAKIFTFFIIHIAGNRVLTVRRQAVNRDAHILILPR